MSVINLRLFRSQNHCQGAAFKFGSLLHRSELLGFPGNFLEHLHPQLGQGNFPSSKYHGYFDFISASDKLPYVADFSLKIMFAGFGAYFDLLYLECALFLFRFLLLFGLAAVVHNFADGRGRIG